MTLRQRSTEEILSSAQADQRYLFYPIIPAGSIIQIYGRQGTGKSTLLVQLAHSIRTGEPWLGFLPSPPPGPVLMLQLDMPENDTNLFMQRMSDAGLNLDGLTILDAPEGFNIKKRPDQKSLGDICHEIRPSAVICDTINDSFGSSLEGNEDVRYVLNTFQRCVNPATFIFTNHTRKKGAYIQALEEKRNEEFDDPDSFSGYGAWEQKATSSLFLADWKDGFRLVFRKVRHKNPGFREIALERVSPHGIFKASTTHGQALVQWPSRVAASEPCGSVLAVCKAIAKETGATPDAVRKMHQRMVKRGVNPLSQLFSEE